MQKYQIVLYRLLISIIHAVAFIVEKKGHQNVLIQKNPNTNVRRLRVECQCKWVISSLEG